ncbi:flagellar export chaperone FliS [Thiohalorhabdus methylotrophus]|uniref:Flagellar secretion chaperone FliS n=1 Tax=Thiohalorhabdus methylotrophus TaxID=3242694 RepID=A0ABV4TY23_9GAMM
MKNPYSQYRKTQVENASREDLLIQLYEKAIGNIRQARELWDGEDGVRARELLMRALDIVYELDSTLDREQGGDVVEHLEALYDFLEREITQANLQGEFHRLGSVQEVLETLYQGWREAVRQHRYEQSSGATQDVAG